MLFRSHSLQEIEKAMEESGSQVLGGVFVQCYNDCPKEIEWVYGQAKQSSKLLGVVGGLDITKYEKMKELINKYKGREEGPKFLGVRYLLAWDQEDFMLREDALKGLQILADNNLTFDWHTPTSGCKRQSRGVTQRFKHFCKARSVQSKIFLRLQ